MQLVFSVLGLALLTSPILGYQSFQEQIPNGKKVPHPCQDNLWGGVGHQNPLGGGTRNQFGRDFHDMGYWWSEQLCRTDSDGDGKTNGEELGDPNCVWKSLGQDALRTTDITHPGVCEPYDDEKCKSYNTFLNCAEKEECEVIKNADVMNMDVAFSRTEIPATETNYYCMTFDLPADQDYHLVATEPMIDNAELVHHMLLYACKTTDFEPTTYPQSCGMESGGECDSVIGLWAVGFDGECYGEDMGHRIGLTGFKRVRLEIHYNNPRFMPGMTDGSGMKLYYQPAKPGVLDLATFWLGQNVIEIPPGRSEVKHTAVCSGDCLKYIITKPAYIINVLNHMHYLGSKMMVEQYRDGKKINTLSYDEYYSYDAPVNHRHDPPVKLMPGDELKTTCIYNSMSTDRYTYFGEATSDEMCYAFVKLYPADALTGEGCVNYGPLDSCALYMGTPIGACDWKTFTNISHPANAEMLNAVQRNCNNDGFCRPECREALRMLEDHPCLEGEAEAIVKGGLALYKEGLDFLNRLHSCPIDHSDKTCSWDECSDVCGWGRPDDGSVHSHANKMAAGTFVGFVLAMATSFAMLN